MHGLCEFADKELKKLERKVEETGDLNEREIEYGKNLAKFKMALLTNEAMERDSDGRSYGGYRNTPHHEDGMSYGHGRTGNVRRDSMGRYSNDGMSYGDAREELMMSLREYMKTATEDEKHDARRFMNALKNA